MWYVFDHGEQTVFCLNTLYACIQILQWTVQRPPVERPTFARNHSIIIMKDFSLLLLVLPLTANVFHLKIQCEDTVVPRVTELICSIT